MRVGRLGAGRPHTWDDRGRVRVRLLLLVTLATVTGGATGCASDVVVEAAKPLSASTARPSPAPSPPKLRQAEPLPGMPADFVRLRDVLPGAVFEMRYAGHHNFTGAPVPGYTAPECWVTRAAAAALTRAQRSATRRGYTLKFYDCFRPQRAVDEFVRWAADDSTTTKREFYPSLAKDDLFPQGYIAAKSGHSRGSTVDVTLVPADDGPSPDWEPGDRQVRCTAPAAKRFPDTGIDMGTGFDCFDPLANTADPRISATARANRDLLGAVMNKAGFTNLPEEWWHYTLRDEPYPDTYFDSEITR